MKKNSFVEGTFIATFAIFFSKFLGMIYVIPFYAMIGEQGGALYAYAYNIYLVFLGISTAGLPIAMSKIISEYDTLEMKEAKERSYKIARNIILTISIIAFVILFAFAEEFALLILGDVSGGNSISDVAYVIRAVSFCLIIVPFLSVTRGYLQGHKFISAPSISQVIEQIVRIFIILAGSYTVLNVLKGTVTTAVGVSVFAAFVSGVVAYIYLKVIIRKNKDEILLPKGTKKDNVKTKEIVKKILAYSIPLILVNIATNIYTLIDMVFINRGLNILGFPGPEVETITSIVTTWSTKIGMIVNAIATGMCVSLIPHITSSYVKKDYKRVNTQFNRALQIMIAVSFPMAIGLCLLANPVYTLFFGESEYGPVILMFSIFVAALANLYFITTTTLQGLNKFKWVYISTFTGFALNAALDLPLILLFGHIGIYPFYGALAASTIGYTVSFMIPCIYLKKTMNLNYSKTFEVIRKMIIPTLLMTIVLFIFNLFLPIHTTNYLINIGITLLYTVVGGGIYLVLMYKNGALTTVFGEAYINKILKKLKVKK